VAAEEVAGGMIAEIGTEIETETVVEKWSEIGTIEICEEMIEDRHHFETIEAEIENGAAGTASEGEDLLRHLVEDDLRLITTEILEMRLRAWIWTVPEDLHETAHCLQHRLPPSHLNHLSMATAELGEMGLDVDVGDPIMMNTIIDPKVAVDLRNLAGVGELSLPQVSHMISDLFSCFFL
jgi:hypothetical protein